MATPKAYKPVILLMLMLYCSSIRFFRCQFFLTMNCDSLKASNSSYLFFPQFSYGLIVANTQNVWRNIFLLGLLCCFFLFPFLLLFFWICFPEFVFFIYPLFTINDKLLKIIHIWFYYRNWPFATEHEGDFLKVSINRLLSTVKPV